MKHFYKLLALGWAGLLVSSSIFAESRTIYSDDGISQLRVSENWAVRPDVNRSATLRIADSDNENYFLVHTYRHDEIKSMPFSKFAKEVSAGLLDNLEDGKLSPARRLTVNGRSALEYEISGILGDNHIVYLSTVVKGRNAWHHLLGTTQKERYKVNREALRAIVASFRESSKQRPAKERIDLVFDWPDQTESKFAYYSKRTKRGVSHEIKLNGTTRLRALADGQLLVSTQVSDFQLSPIEKDNAKNSYLNNLMQKLTSQIPDYSVSAGGEFIRVDKLDAYYARIEQGLLEGLPGDTKQVRQIAKHLTSNVLSEQVLAQSIQDDWNNLVGSWVGSSFAFGEIYTFKGRYQAAALGESTFPMTITQRLFGRVPCNQDDKGNHCVKLEQRSQVLDPTFTKGMQTLLNRTLKGIEDDKGDAVNIGIDRVGFVKTVTLVTNPKTLLPHELRISKITTIAVTEKGHTATTEDIDDSIVQYVY